MSNLPVFLRPYVHFFLALSLMAGSLLAAPYGPDGKPVVWTQPDGTKVSLKVHGDEFYARTETQDGFTVVFDPKTKTYYYADLDAKEKGFRSTGKAVGSTDPQSIGLKKGLKLKPEDRAAKAQKNAAAFEAVVKQQERWDAVKASNRNYRAFKNQVKKQEKSGKKGFAIPLGTIFPDSNVPPAPQMAAPKDEANGETGPELGPPSFTLTGDVVGLTILVDFSDDPGTAVTQPQVDDYFNKPNYTGFGNSGSVYDYFFIQSGGRLRYSNNVTYYVRVPQPKTYYDDTSVDSGLCGRLLLNDALDVLIADGYDFSALTTKSGGNVRACNIFFAGNNSGVWAKGLWPHRWVLSPSKSVGSGMQIYDYQITNIGNASTLKIGTVCHENGHMLLGYPDLYSYNGNASNVGNFSLMASGNYGGSGYHPTNIDPYLKTASGWADIVELDSTSSQRCTVQVDNNLFYRYLNPSESREYFMFEVRDNTGYEGPYGGHSGSVNPATGLLAYHLREHGTNTQSTIFTADSPNADYTKPYELLVLEANPSASQTPWYDNPTPGSNDAFKSSDKNQISDATTPSLKFWNTSGRGVNSGGIIHSISSDSSVMTFIAGAGSPSGSPNISLSRANIYSYCDFGASAPPKTFSICNGKGGTLNYSISDNQSWLSCTPTSGSVTTGSNNITVNFNSSTLNPGTYTGTITVTDPSASPTSETITVTLTIAAKPVMELTTTSISEAAIAGTVGPQASFGVSNSGGGSMGYTVSGTQPWLSISPTSGTVVGETDTIYVNFDATSLSAGTYNDTITVTSSDADNSPLTIPVTFIVQSTDMILTAPTGGETWFLNTTQDITWASSLGGNVKIELFKGGSLDTTIESNVPNNGSYTWSIPGGQTPGSDYKIRVTSLEPGSKSDESITNFSIAEDLLAAALDTTGLSWLTSGNTEWFRQTTTTHDGVDAAESGNITHSQSSSMETTIVGPGTMTFWWKVSSEANYDYLRFYLNDVEQTGSLAKIAGNVDWTQKTVNLPAGSNVVKWTYSKDGSVDGGSDTAWVDQVVFTPDSQPEIAVEQPVSTGLTDGVSTVDFGSVNTGSDKVLTFTVRNVGTADLIGLALSKSGANSADFTLGSLVPTLAAGASTTFTVTFNTAVAGTRTALLQIASDDADENPFDINLTASGIGAGSLEVAGAGGFASSGNYGGGFTPASLQYTLSNPGNTTINWTAGKTQSWVSLSSTGGTLAAGASTNVTVSINTGANSLNAGSYNDTVTFTNSTNSNGNTTRGVALTVNPLAATVTLGNLAQTYDGSPKSASVVTNPGGLAHVVTYNGSGTVPTNAGTHAVVATITAPNYAGSASGDLVIAKATQAITFGALSPVLDNAASFNLTATASSGLAVSYTSSNTSVATVSGNTVTIVGLGSTTITASQSGNINYQAAASVGQTLTVVRSNPLAVTGGPYKVIVGQSLSLNGSASEPSYGYTITNYEWDLDNNGSFNDATGATPAAIDSSTLISTWGMVTTGPNTIQLRVTDSDGKTSTVATTVELINALTWDANGTTAGQTNGGGGWLDANKWWDGTNNLTWTPGANASFGGPSTNGGNVTLASPTSVGSITFSTHTGTYTLGTAGQMLTINGGIDKTATSAAAKIVSPMTLGANQTWTNESTGTLTISDALDTNGFTPTLDGPGYIAFTGSTSAIISGSGGVTVNSSGRVALGANPAPLHTYSGDTNIIGGVLMFGGNFSPNSNIHISNGILESYWSTATTMGLGTAAGEIRITGGESGFSLNGNTGQTINLGNSGASITWGSTYFSPSKFVLQSPYSQTNSSIVFANGLDLNGVTRTVLVNGGIAGTSRATISGAISNSTGTAGFIKEGVGLLTLSNNSSAWNGTTTISDGVLDFAGNSLANIGGGSGRNISVATGKGVRFNTLSNAFLNRIVETTGEITVMTATTSNNFDFSSSTGANLPNAFLGNWASNGAKCEYSGTLTPAADNYRLGSTWSKGLLGIRNESSMTGNRGLIIGGSSVELVGAKTFTGDTVIRSGGRLGLAAISGGSGVALGLQNSALDVGSSGGNIWFESGSAGGPITGSVATTSAIFGGLKGSRDLAAVYSTGTGANNSNATAVASITGFTLNPGSGKSPEYSGAIADFATGTTITKTGLGTQILAGANTYTGATTVSAGKLLINGSLSNTAAALNVASGATLGGTGTVGRNVTIATGGQLEFDISTIPASHDSLDISAGRGFGFSGNSILTITSAGGASTGSYTLVTGGNNITGSAPSTLILPSGWVATVSISGNSLILNVTSVSGGSGSLAVTGTAGLSSSGYVGGPFSPSSIVYTLSNPGQLPIDWTANKTVAWLDLSSTSGTLAAGANTTVTVSINANANALGVGPYSDTVSFSNTTNSVGDTTRSVSLTVNPPNTYVISYNGNNNTSGTAPSNQIKTQDVDVTLSGPGTLARNGYTFSAWNTSATGGGTPYAAGASYTANADLTLYAKWTANNYSVAFDANGGDVPTITSKQVTYDSTYGALGTTSRSGYTFNGWFTAASGGTEVTTTTVVNTANNHTLYAQWTADTYTVTFNSNGGDAPSPTTKVVSHGEAYGALATATRDGYTLDGWFTAASGGTEVTEATQVTAIADHELYAQWSVATYTVSYDANGAESGSAPSDQTKTHDINLVLASNSGNLVRTGYTFSGWNTETDGSGVTYGEGVNYTNNSDLILYAKWTATTSTVTFDANGGTTSVPISKVVSYGSTYGTLATTSRSGYNFSGWFTAAIGGIEVTDITVVTALNNHILYARWTQVLPEMEVTRSTNEIAAGGYDSITGSIAGADSKLTYTITNSGSDPLTLSPAVISGESNCTVVIDNQPNSSVAASGGTTSLILTANPTAAGTWSFTVSMDNNDADENPYSWTIHGVASSSTTVTLTAIADTYIANKSTSSNYGTQNELSIFNRTPSSNLRYGLLKFDLTGIPTSATVTAASLDLVQSNNNSGNLFIYAADGGTGDWTETGATWSNSSTRIANTLFGSAAVPGATDSNMPNIGMNPDGLNEVRSWVADSGNNKGFGVKTTNSSNKTNIDLHSREATNAAYRPKLNVDYTVNTLAAEIHVTRSGVSVASGATDSISGSAAGNGQALTYTIANLGNAELTMTTPIAVSAQTNCSVVVNTQPANTVAAFSEGTTYVAGMVITVTPTSSGAWFADLSITNNDPDEGTYSWTISGSAMSPYDLWANGPAFNVDTNGDGIDNGMAWFLGATDPSSNARVLLPTIDSTSDPNYFIYEYRRSDSAHSDLSSSILVQHCSDLSSWATAVHDGDNVIISETNDGYGAGVDKVEVKIKRTFAAGEKVFCRLRADLNP